MDALLDTLLNRFNEEDSPEKQLSERLCSFLDQNARYRNRNKTPDKLPLFVANIVIDYSLTIGLAHTLHELFKSLEVRQRELEDQEKLYWSIAHRPPNHYARTIALRFARLIATETGKRPTFGTSRDGGHPSTDFGRALEEIFSLLEIKASVRGPATWAIGQLTDEDLGLRRNAMRDYLMQTEFGRPEQSAVRPKIVEALMKGIDE